MEIKRPLLNQRLGARLVGVVEVAVGGIHCAALTHDNKILTWGVNDEGALGRKIDEGRVVGPDAVEGKAGEEEDRSGSGSEARAAKRKTTTATCMQDSGLNASEAEPREVDPHHFPAGTKFAQVVATDSTTFAVTTTGLVYGWGSFRVCTILTSPLTC